MKQKTYDKRMQKLAHMLNRNANAWSKEDGSDPSPRMCSWVDEYNYNKGEHKEMWKSYCKTFGLSLEHDAYDCMA